MKHDGDNIDERFYAANLEDIMTLDRNDLCFILCKFVTETVMQNNNDTVFELEWMIMIQFFQICILYWTMR